MNISAGVRGYILTHKDEFTKRIHFPSFCFRYKSSCRSPEKTSSRFSEDDWPLDALYCYY